MEELASCERAHLRFRDWAPHWKLFFFEAYTCWSVYRCFANLQATSIVRVQSLLSDLLRAKDSEEYGQHLRRWVFISLEYAHFTHSSLVDMLFPLFQVSRIAGEFGTWIKKLWKKIKRLIIVSASMFVLVTKYIVLYYRYNKVSTEMFHCRLDFSWPCTVDRTLQVPLLLYCFVGLLTGLQGSQ